MKTAIVYVSTHHQNTLKLAEKIADECSVDLINALIDPKADLSGYDCIGLAAGIAYGKFYSEMLNWMKEELPENKKVFFLFTCGLMQTTYTRAAREIATEKNATILGEYGCLGFDTFGPFKLIGGLAKGHPDEKELQEAVDFYRSICF